METLTLLIVSIILLEASYIIYKGRTIKLNKEVERSSIVCDTSALIDGRIVSVAQSGFLSEQLIVTKSVLRELQYMADKADHDKRERARYGLDVVKQLQEITHISVVILDDGEIDPAGVDEQLITVAKQYKARLCTTDYNLNKVAVAESIIVVNVNELAHAIRTVHLPGEHFDVLVTDKGQGRNQGVGYLDDGTMVVIDNAKGSVGKTVPIEVTRMLQTEAGRMVFAKMQKSTDSSEAKQVVNTTQNVKNNRKTYRKQGKSRKSPEDDLVALANE